MRKRISLKTRRPDLSTSQFRDHYENRHVPLGLSFIERFQWRRYVRNYIERVTGAEIHFDCYAEFWVSEDFDDASLEAFIASPDFRVLNEDDRRFLDVDQRASFEVEEWAVKSPDGQPAMELVKRGVCWSRQDDRSSTRAIAKAMADSLGETLYAASLDTQIGPVSVALPFDTLLTLWMARDAPLVLDSSVRPEGKISDLDLDPIETPVERLASGQAG